MNYILWVMHLIETIRVRPNLKGLECCTTDFEFYKQWGATDVYNQESTIVIPVFQKNSQEQRRVKNKGREVQGNVPQWCAAALSYQS